MGMLRFLLVVLTFLTMTAVVPLARAQTPPSDLMTRIGAYAERFETLRKTATYNVEGKLDSVDGSGRPDSSKFMRARVDMDPGHKMRFSILQYLEDGHDKTLEAQNKQKQRDADASREPPSNKREWRMPFHPREQPRYWFSVVEADPQNASRVRIGFVPKIVEDDTIEGSAWVDVRTGGLISAGFKLSKPPSIVDSVHVTMMFGESTTLGPAPSRIAVDARGGILFVRKRYHGEATLSQYALVP
jgi:hypothetical protein